jgi:hypothetical protein
MATLAALKPAVTSSGITECWAGLAPRVRQLSSTTLRPRSSLGRRTYRVNMLA